MSPLLKKLLVVSTTLMLTACPLTDDGGQLPPSLSCEPVGEMSFVYSTMQEWYYWYDKIPAVNAGNYSNKEELLDAIRYETFDTTFTYLTTVEAEQAFLNNAAYIGFGFSTTIKNGDELYLREVFEGGPSDMAGLARGDRLLEINGNSVATLLAADALQDAYGASEVGVTRRFLVEHPDSSQETISVTKDEVTIPVVSNATTFNVGGDTVGYVFFRSFNNAAYNALDSVFADFKAAGVTRLILDLRYNGGGLISVAEHLGGLIGGADNPGAELSTMQFNDKKQAYNVVLHLNALAQSIALTDMVVITTESTASASELIINGLGPYMNVSTVGSTSFGKPVGQSGFTFCGNVLRAVTFEVVNSDGVGGYFNGIAPTCAANDEVTEALGSSTEASVEEAISLMDTGSCSATATKAARQNAYDKALYPPRRQVRDGWDVLTGNAR